MIEIDLRLCPCWTFEWGGSLLSSRTIRLTFFLSERVKSYSSTGPSWKAEICKWSLAYPILSKSYWFSQVLNSRDLVCHQELSGTKITCVNSLVRGIVLPAIFVSRCAAEWKLHPGNSSQVKSFPHESEISKIGNQESHRLLPFWMQL